LVKTLNPSCELTDPPIAVWYGGRHLPIGKYADFETITVPYCSHPDGAGAKVNL
jgi:hypothetical protein